MGFFGNSKSSGDASRFFGSASQKPVPEPARETFPVQETSWPTAHEEEQQPDNPEYPEKYSRTRPARKLPPAHQGTGGASLTSEDTALFLEGQEMICSSEIVKKAYYLQDAEELVITFTWGPRVFSGVTFDEALRFATSRSKGKFYWDILRGFEPKRTRKASRPLT